MARTAPPLTPRRLACHAFLTRLLALPPPRFLFFFFNDTATTEIYTLSLHDALPISQRRPPPSGALRRRPSRARLRRTRRRRSRKSAGAQSRPSSQAATLRSRRPTATDRKSTRLNSSHDQISYAVFCLKKKKKERTNGKFEFSTSKSTSNNVLADKPGCPPKKFDYPSSLCKVIQQRTRHAVRVLSRRTQ